MSAYNEKEKIIAMPIIDWTDADVWHFLNSNNIPHCELYDKGYKRIGCILCPMAYIKLRRKQEVDFPKYKEAYMRAIDKIYNHSGNFDSAEDMYEWWLSNKSIKQWKADKKQLKLDL